MSLAAAAVAGVLAGGCVSTMEAPPGLSAGPCEPEAALVGTWRSTRFSQLGPAVMTFRFDCDCTYVAKTHLLFASLRERGTYGVREGRLSLSRASGKITAWPFRLEAGRLLLEEHDEEVHAYTRRRLGSCGDGGAAPP